MTDDRRERAEKVYERCCSTVCIPEDTTTHWVDAIAVALAAEYRRGEKRGMERARSAMLGGVARLLKEAEE